MKKILALTAAILLAASVASAKTINPGTIEVGGGASAGYQSTSNGSSVSTLHLDLDATYYLMSDVGVGAYITYLKLGDDADSSALALGAQAVYDYPLQDAVNAYGEVRLGMISEDPTGDASESSWEAGAAVGVKYFLSDAISTNCELGFSHAGGDFDSNTFGVILGLSIYLP
jgi:hypothetical protein